MQVETNSKPKRDEGKRVGSSKDASSLNTTDNKGKRALESSSSNRIPTISQCLDQGPSIKEKKNKVYSRRDKVKKIFKDALKNGLEQPESKRTYEANMHDEPNFCPYYNILGHPIEDCYMFKDWVEKQYKAGTITLSKSIQVHISLETKKHVQVAEELFRKQIPQRDLNPLVLTRGARFFPRR